MVTSGGTLAYNLREGFRSEHLAHYALSAFGPVTPFLREDDHGIDMICHIAKREGKMAIVGNAYGAQVKSGEPLVVYTGEQACEWLMRLQFPLFVVTVDKAASSVRVYSTWNLHLLLLPFQHNRAMPRPQKVTLIGTNAAGPLGKPDCDTGDVPLGHPILDFPIDDLGDPPKREKYLEIMSEWVDMDARNYHFRLAGISLAHGYIEWQTNRSLNESRRTWYHPYYFSPETCDKARKLVSELATVIALYQGNVRDRSRDPEQAVLARHEVDALRSYLQGFCDKHLTKFQKDILKIK